MNIKKTAKKIVAIGAGIGLAGATMMAALAAAPNLANYPQQFVDNGQFNGNIVVGANAAAEDIIASNDIIGSLVQAAGAGSSSETVAPSVGGDVRQVRSPGDILEFGEPIADVLETLSDGDLAMLASGQAETRRGTTSFTQVLRMGDHSVVFEERQLRNGQRQTAPFLFFRGNNELFEYELDFSSGLRSSKVSLGNDRFRAVDLEDETIFMLGGYYTIVNAEVGPNSSSPVSLTLLAGDVSDTLSQGQTRTYTVDGESYEVTVLAVGTGSDPQVRLVVNGQTTRSLRAGQTDTVAGIEVGIRDVLSTNQQFEGAQASLVEFWLGANRMVIDVSASGVSSNSIELDRESVSSVSATLGYTSSSTEFRLNNIMFNVAVDADYRSDIHVGAGEGVRQFLRYPQAMLNDQWDITFEGVTQPQVTAIEFNPRGDDEFEMTFTNNRGQEFTFPLAFSNGNNLFLGDDRSNTVMHERVPISLNDYFVVSHRENERQGDSYVLEFTNIDTTRTEVDFRHGSTGQTVRASYNANNLYDDVADAVDNVSDPSGTFLLGGQEYSFWIVRTPSSSVNTWQLLVDLNNDNQLNDIGTPENPVNIVVHGGGILSINADAEWYNRSASDQDDLEFTLTIPSELLDGSTPVETSWSIRGTTLTGSQTIDIVRPVNESNTYFNLERVRNTDVDEGFDQYGSFYRFETLTNSPNRLDIHFPREQVEALVFVTGGEVTRTGMPTPGGQGFAINPIGLSVLDTEVNYDQTNMIVVGGPCANTMAARLLGNPTDCEAGFVPGMGMVRSFDTGNNVAVLVAGYSARDTVESSRVLARAATQNVPGFSGESVEVVIASAGDVSVRAPSQQ